MLGQIWNPFWRFPRAALTLACLLAVIPLYRLTGFRVSSEVRVLLEGDQRNLSSYEKVKQILADTEVLIVSLELPEVFSAGGIEAIRRVSRAFEPLPGVIDVKSLTHSSKPVRKGMTFEMEPLVPERPLTGAELRALKGFSLGHPLVRNLMVADDSRHAIVMVTFDDRFDTPEKQRAFRREIETALAPLRAEGLRLQTLALPLVEEEVRATLRSDVRIILPVAAVSLLAILMMTFRSWRVVLVVLVNAMVVLLALPGAIELAGFSLNVFSVILLPLLAGVHLMLLIHVYTATQRALAHGWKGDEAVQRMLAETFQSCSFASITSVIGLLSLTLSRVEQVRQFGILGGLGVAWVFFMTFGPGLSLLQLVCRHSWLGDGTARPLPPADAATSKWADVLVQWVDSRRRMILLGVGVVLAGAMFGIGKVRTDIRAVEFLHPRSSTRQVVEELDRIYGGINVVQLELDAGKPGGVNGRTFLEYVDGVQKFAESRPGISGAYSYAQLMTMMNQIWEDGEVAALKLPDSPFLLPLFVMALRSQEYPFLSALADPTFQVAYVILRSRDMPADRYLSLLDEVVSFARQSKPPGVEVSAARGMHSILEADRRIVRSQIDTVGGTLVVIGIVLALLWRSPVLALLSLVTNAIPVAVVIAVAGFCGIPLNSITIMVSAVAFGIAVDDSVHLITCWRNEFQNGATAAVAAANALRVKGRAIISTSVALIAIFVVFAFSSFPPVIHFGLLSAIAFTAALATVLLFLPAMLCLRRKAG